MVRNGVRPGGHSRRSKQQIKKGNDLNFSAYERDLLEIQFIIEI